MAGAIDRYPGDIVIGSGVTGDFPFASDRGWVMALKTQLPRAKIGAIHADGELFADMRQKLARAGTARPWRWIWKAILPARSPPPRWGCPLWRCAAFRT
jgi:hypothetical protein